MRVYTINRDEYGYELVVYVWYIRGVRVELGNACVESSSHNFFCVIHRYCREAVEI